MAFSIRNIPNKTQALCEMERVVIPEGQIIILELSAPHPGSMKEIYSFYLNNILPKVATLFTSNPSAYEYLADSIIN